jgi:hypothetical protein
VGFFFDERDSHLGEREGQERGVVVGDEAAHALEADGLRVEARELGVPERAPQADGLRHERGDFEGHHAHLLSAAPQCLHLPHPPYRQKRELGDAALAGVAHMDADSP